MRNDLPAKWYKSGAWTVGLCYLTAPSKRAQATTSMKKFICIHCGATEYNKHDNGEPCQRCMGKMVEVKEELLCSTETALTALREKAERSKG